MANESPGVVVVTKFCESGSKQFAEYITYMDRDEAIRNDQFDLYSLYNEYMDNPEKSSGLFTADKNQLSQEEKRKAKDVFLIAQEKESLMWQTVISFDNSYLEENGLLDKKSGFLNEDKIKELTRGTVRNILKAENMDDSTFWTASIHYNTDNIHIHIATVEPDPQREVIKTGKYAGHRKGTFKPKSIRSGKSYAVNYILDHAIDNKRINELIRDNIINNKKKHPFYKDKKFIKKFMELHNKMPADKRLWNYSMNKLKYIRPELDSLVSLYLNEYHKNDMKELKTLLEKTEKIYKRSYGQSTNNFVQNKIDDLYKRMGNVILKEMKEYDKELKKSVYDEEKKQASKEGRKVEQHDLQAYINKEEKNTEKNNYSRNNDKVKKSGNEKNIKYRHKSSCFQMIGTLEKLKRSMRDELQHARNEYEYQTDQYLIEQNNLREQNQEDISF